MRAERRPPNGAYLQPLRFHPLVDVEATDLGDCAPLHLRDNEPECLAAEGIAVQRLGVEHELVALALDQGRGDRHLAAALMAAAPCLADALRPRSAPRIDLRAARAAVLVTQP